MIRSSFSASQPAHPFGEYVYKTLGYKKVVTLGMDYPFGWEQVGGFQKTYEQAGGKVVQKLWAPLGFTDFTALIKQIPKDTDAVLIATIGPPATIIPKQLKESGLNKPIIGTGVSFDEEVLPTLNDDVMGVVSAAPYSATLNTSSNKHFVKEYSQKYGSEPGYFSQATYSFGMWLNNALDQSPTPNSSESLLSALKTTQLKESPRGPMKLDAYGNMDQNIYIRRLEKINGKLRNTVIFTYPMVSQFWRYDPKEFLKAPLYSKDYPPCQNCETK